jgi:hypothetical protein
VKRWLVPITGLLCLVSCDQYQVVDTHDQDTKLINIKTCNCQIVAKDEFRTLREQAELGRHVNRYQMRNEGYRTWRFDTASGKVCLLLTTDWDWKKPEVASQNCIYERD